MREFADSKKCGPFKFVPTDGNQMLKNTDREAARGICAQSQLVINNLKIPGAFQIAVKMTTK